MSLENSFHFIKMYTAVILDNQSKNLLKTIADRFVQDPFANPSKWHCHHLTLHMGKPTEEEIPLIGIGVVIAMNCLGLSDKAFAAGSSGMCTTSGVILKTVNKKPHVTIAVDSILGKPKDSNDITLWTPHTLFILSGHLAVCE